MPRKTDSHEPADWLWIAAIDLSVIQHWPLLREQLQQVIALHSMVQARVGPASADSK